MSSTVEKSTDAVARRGSPKTLTYSQITSNTTTALIAAVSNLRIRVYKILISGTATVAAGILTFQDGSTTRIVRNVSVVSLGYVEDSIDLGDRPWELADGAALNCVTTGATAMTYNITVVFDQLPG